MTVDSATIRVRAATDQLVVVREHVLHHTLAAGFAQTVAHNVALAVDEACANLIQHAYQNDASKDIEVSVAAMPDAVCVTITDTSAPFDPNSAELPDMRRYFIERRHHGLGILLMTKVMDSIEYQPAANGSDRNVLTLVKHR